MATPSIKFKGVKVEVSVEQIPEPGNFVMVMYDGDSYLACGADDCDWFILFPEDAYPFSVELCELTVIKDVEVEITVK